MRGGRIFWGLLILLIGAVLLLEPLGVIPAGTSVWKFIWPGVIILLGIWLLVMPAIYRGKQLQTENLSIPVGDASQGKIRLKHGAGMLKVSAGDDPAVFLSGTFSGGIDQSLRQEEGVLKLKLRTPPQVIGFPMALHFEGLNWDVKVNRTLPLRLDIDSGASENKLDLTDLKVHELNLDTGASSSVIRFPAAAGLTRARIESGAASVEIRIPEGVAARIGVESGLAGIHIDQKRFPRSGSFYVSHDFDQAVNKADIFVHTGVGSLDVQ